MDCLIGHIHGPNAFQNGLYRTFQGEEILFRTIEAQRKEFGFLCHAVLPLEVGAAQLIQTHSLVAVVVVPGEDFQHGGSTVVRMMEVSSPRGFMIFMDLRRGSPPAGEILS